MPKEIKRYKILCECDDNTDWVKYLDHLEGIQTEIEACAKVLEDTKAYNFTLDQLVAKIRARSEE